MKFWKTAVFLFALITGAIALELSGILRGILDWVMPVVIFGAIGGFIILGKRRVQ